MSASIPTTAQPQAQSSGQNGNQTPLQPTLYAMLPPSLRPSLISHLSLQSAHIEGLELVDKVYVTSNPVISGQLRYLRLRSILRSSNSRSSSASGNSSSAYEGKGVGQERLRWTRELAYISSPLRGAEYAEASTRALIGLDVQGAEDEEDLDMFVKALGFEHSHSYRLSGHLFHLPLPITPSNPSTPPLTLHLSITRLVPLFSSSTNDTTATKTSIIDTTQHLDESATGPSTGANSGGSGARAEEESEVGSEAEPYLVQLSPSRPVLAVPSSESGDVGLSSVIAYMRDLAGRVELEWITAGGR